MALRRGRNIESLLASKLEDDGSRLSDFGEQGRQARVDGRRIREYFVARGKPDDYQYSPSEAKEAMNYFKAIDKSKGDWEGASSPFLQGPSSYDETFKYKDAILGMTPDSETLEEAAIDEASDKEWERYEGINEIDSSGPDIFKQKYSDSETLSDLAEDEASEEQAELDRRQALYDPEADKDDLGPDKTDVESSFWERTKQGRVGDAFSGLFSSDSGRDESLAQETKDNEALAGKIGAAAKLYSLLKPETPQAAPTIPSAKISRGSVAFPGMKLASQKARRKYFTPKGLMA